MEFSCTGIISTFVIYIICIFIIPGSLTAPVDSIKGDTDASSNVGQEKQEEAALENLALPQKSVEPLGKHIDSKNEMEVQVPETSQVANKVFSSDKGSNQPPLLDQVNQDIFSPDINVDLSPKEVAEYLLISGDFQSFDDAISVILDAKLMTPEEVDDYREQVGSELDAFLQRLITAETQYLEDINSEMRSRQSNGLGQLLRSRGLPADVLPDPRQPQPQLPVMPAVPLQQSALPYPSNNPQLRQPFGIGSYGSPIRSGGLSNAELQDTIRQLQLRSMLQQEESYDQQLLQGIVEEYLLRSIQQQNTAENQNTKETDVPETFQNLTEKAIESEVESKPVEDVVNTKNKIEVDDPVQQLTQVVDKQNTAESA